MRLPTINQRQRYLEDARALQEQIWAAHEAGEAYQVPGDPEPLKSLAGKRLHSNLHGFWRSRGFRLSVTLRADRRLQMTLSPASIQPRRKRAETEADLAWTA